MPASGNGFDTVDMGAFPGSTNSSRVITGQTLISSTANVEAWLVPSDTPEHPFDDHLVEEIDITAGFVSAGNGFTIYAKTRNVLLHGQYSIGWAWVNP